MSILSDLLVGKKEHSQTTQRSQTNQRRGPTKAERQPLDLLIRAIVGQMTNPPNTAIAAPLQQAVSMLQQGGGSLAGRLANPLPPGGGMQSREQLGLPDRSSYFTFMPTADQVAALGVQPVRRAPLSRKNEGAVASAEKAGNQKKAARLKQRQPERYQ